MKNVSSRTTTSNLEHSVDEVTKQIKLGNGANSTNEIADT